MNLTRVYERIAKLERLAADPGTPEEGRAAFEKARSLRKKYGLLELYPISTEEVSKTDFYKIKHAFRAPYSDAIQTLRDFGY